MWSTNRLSFSTPVLTPLPLPPPPPGPQIIFESMLGAQDVGNDCTMTIDGTDFHTQNTDLWASPLNSLNLIMDWKKPVSAKNNKISPK